MTEPTPDPRSGQPDDGFEVLLRQRLHQLADHAPTAVRSLDEIRVQHGSRPITRREGRSRRAAGIGATIAALAGAIGFTTIALSGAGTSGAASPEEAVRQFINATSDEDILGMIDAIDPAEAPGIRAAAEAGRADAVEADLVGEGFSLDGVDGFDLSFAGVDLVTESLDDGLAVVTAAAGSVSWVFDPAVFPLGEQLREVFGDELTLASDSARLGDLVSPAMLATVERDGRWYVSLSFTLAEYARQSADVALPDAPLTAVGADSPEAAADEFFSNVVALDLAGAFATSAPGEGDAVLRYAPLMIDEVGDDIARFQEAGYDLQLSGAGYTVDGDGDRRTVSADTFTISGTMHEPEVYGSFDPTLPTVISAYDGMSIAVIAAGVELPATIDGLDFDPDVVYPDGNYNMTWADEDGTVFPLPDAPVSDGPESIEIRRADGCTTWSGPATQSMFGSGASGPSSVSSDASSGSGASSSSVAGDGDGAGEAPLDEVGPVDPDRSITVGESIGPPGFEQIDEQTWMSCGSASGGLSVLSLFGTSGLTALPSIDVVEVDGRWYVSPIGTVADVVLDVIASVRDSGSLLDSEVAWFVLGTDRASLESMFVGSTLDQLTPECQALVATDGTVVTGLIDGDLDLGDVRACATGSIFSGFSESSDAAPLPDESIEPPRPARPAEPPAVPASTNPP